MRQKKELYLIGVGGHAAVVRQLIADRNKTDDVEIVVRRAFDNRLPEDCAELRRLADHNGKLAAVARPLAAIALGDNALRKALAAEFGDLGNWLPLVHPGAYVSDTTVLAEAVQVMVRAVLNPETRIGRGAIVNSAAVVEHHVTVGAYTHVAPGAVIAGSCAIGAGCLIGAGAVIRENITIGDNAVVGAGAVVIRDVPAGARVVGVPAGEIDR